MGSGSRVRGWWQVEGGGKNADAQRLWSEPCKQSSLLGTQHSKCLSSP